MKKITCLFLLLLASTQFMKAQSRLDDFILDEMDNNHISGLSAILIKDGEIKWKGNYGLANRELNTPVSDATIYMLASVSKTITATALMQLYEDGLFNLDDDINLYLPFSVRNPDYPDSVITIRHLLTHTSSIRDNWNELPYSEGDPTISLADFMYDYLSVNGANYYPALNFYNYPPQAQYNYCNVSAALCGYLVETITGTPFNEYCNENIFEPLCMENTGWFLYELDTNLIARPYSYFSGDYEDQGLYGYADYPDGQLRTTAVSLAKFLFMNLNDGSFDGTQILQSSTIDLMRTDQFPALMAQQGLIWYYYTDNGTWWGHNGGDAGVSTDMYLNEQTNTGLIVLTNSDEDHADIWNEILYAADTMNFAYSIPVACSIAVAISEIKNLPISIYPNPCSDLIHVHHILPGFTVTILDAFGREVKTIRSDKQSELSIDIADLPVGFYSIVTDDGQTVYYSKLIKVL